MEFFIYCAMLKLAPNLMFSENIGIDNHFKQMKKMGFFRGHIIAFLVKNLAAGDPIKSHIKSGFTRIL